ncbi:type VII secretion target [Natronoglycomyces albus]|uniref:Uncharacterized protein n=1 Tax=Natronoglycomyces albus TaxID=2811108 RepID=A0A895XPY6_9ACTN|nr:type VII secretion target [Natronoglycomyces albus]QSB05175.1 hypothetical protein JQS30_15685 [Natronoglycomyces albus]
MTWIDVDAEGLRDAANKLRQAETEIKALGNYAEEADPDLWMFGLAGVGFAGLYFAIAKGIVHPAFSDAEQAVEGICTRLEDCADEYEDCDEGIAQELDKIGQDIVDGAI